MIPGTSEHLPSPISEAACGSRVGAIRTAAASAMARDERDIERGELCAHKLCVRNYLPKFDSLSGGRGLEVIWLLGGAWIESG